MRIRWHCEFEGGCLVWRGVSLFVDGDNGVGLSLREGTKRVVVGFVCLLT